MPWKERTQMSLRLEFVKFALAEDSNIAELCRRFDISRKTGYKWIKRYLQLGEAGLVHLGVVHKGLRHATLLLIPLVQQHPIAEHQRITGLEFMRPIDVVGVLEVVQPEDVGGEQAIGPHVPIGRKAKTTGMVEDGDT